MRSKRFYFILSLLTTAFLLLGLWTGDFKVIASEITSMYTKVFDLTANQRGNANLKSRESYAWGESYDMMAYAVMYEATGDLKYLDSLSYHIEVVLKNRDDNLGLKDYKGRLMPGWGRKDYSNNKDLHYVWAIHTGMLTYPMAQFVRIVYEDESLHKKYKEKADKYLVEIEKSVKAHDEDFVVGPGNNEGYYVFGDATGSVTVAQNLPFNQQNALGRTIIELYKITGKDEYLDKATRLAYFMKHRIYTFPNGSYVWMYSLPPYEMEGPYAFSEYEAAGIAPRCEDTSHAAINADFMVQAYKAGIVFTKEDMEHLVITVLENLFADNGAEYKYIGGVGDVIMPGNQGSTGRWLELGLFDKRVFDKIAKFYGKGLHASLLIQARLVKADIYWQTKEVKNK